MQKKNTNRIPIFAYVGRNWWRYVIGLSALGGSVALDIMSPLVIASIVDEVIVGGHLDLLWIRLVAILCIGVGRGICQYVKEFTMDNTGARVACDIRKNLFNHIQGLSKRYFDRSNTGELMARVCHDVDNLWDVYGFVGMLIIEASSYLIGVIVVMININWKLALIPIACLPLLGVLAIRLEKKLDAIYDDISDQNAALNTVVQENLAGVRTVKSFTREEYEIEKFRKNNEKYSELNIKQADLMAKVDPLITLIPRVMQLLVLLAGGYMVIRGDITYGLLVAFISYAGNIVWPMENIGWMANCVASAVASTKKINKVMGEEPEIADAADAGDLSYADLDGELAFSHVNFSLNDRPILKDISFVLPKGHTLGIMGVTGSGKSTIVNLIDRFYDVEEGAITLDGKDIRTLPLQTVRKASAVVTQDVFLFSDTIEGNIRLGSHDRLTNKEVSHALAAASASEFVDKLAEQENTVIGERGVGLSGGQKQRISIARALAKEAKILILDDATSALDMETEFRIQRELAERSNISKIIIAHRISSVRNADEIIVLSEGAVAERGTHEELMAAKGLYYSTFEAQYGDYHNALEAYGKEGWVCQ